MSDGNAATPLPETPRQCSRSGRWGRIASIGATFGLCLLPLLAWCGETVSVCYNWSCHSEAPVTFSDPLLAGVEKLLRGAASAEDERRRIAQALGRLYAEAARQTPIGDDRPGNRADADSPGRMDCIDHSITTTRLMRLFEAHGWLRWHRVGERAWRAPYIFNEHYAAVIEELLPPAPPASAQGDEADEEEPPRYAVDSWYVLPGEAPLVLPLENWLKGEGPDVD